MRAASQSVKYDGVIFVRCPPALPEFIASAARKGMTSASNYVRTAVLAQLRRDGFDASAGGLGSSGGQEGLG